MAPIWGFSFESPVQCNRKVREEMKSPDKKAPDNDRRPPSAATTAEITSIIICKSYNGGGIQPFQRQLQIRRGGGGTRASRKRHARFCKVSLNPTRWLVLKLYSWNHLQFFIMLDFARIGLKIGSEWSNIKTMHAAESKFWMCTRDRVTQPQPTTVSTSPHPFPLSLISE